MATPTQNFNSIRNGNLSSQQIQFLQDGLKTIVKDWRSATDEINRGLRAAASSSSSTSSTTPVSTTLGGGVFAMLGDLYDRYRTEAFRMGKEDVANLMKDVTSAIASGSVMGVGVAVKNFFKKILAI